MEGLIKKAKQNILEVFFDLCKEEFQFLQIWRIQANKLPKSM